MIAKDMKLVKSEREMISENCRIKKNDLYTAVCL